MSESSEALRTILHVDLDAFYAAVEVRENPTLRGQPLIIGADPQAGKGRGVVCTASYEAREYGVHSAMPVSRAYRLCPQGIYLPPRPKLYGESSQRFFQILKRFSNLVEPLSIDEAFVDVTGSQRLFGDGEAIAEQIQAAVQEEEHITASIGVAPVKFAAKIASDLRKPRGLVVVDPQRLQEFLDPLPVKRLFGAGPRALERFRSLGIHTLGELRQLSREALQVEFGDAAADHYYRLCRGEDPRAVVPDRGRKSLGKETTFSEDVADRARVRRTLMELAESVVRSLRREQLRGRTVTIKLRTEDFRTVTRSATLAEPADTLEAIWPTAEELFQSADQTVLAIRLIGISLSQLGAPQRGLFAHEGEEKSRRLGATLDELRQRFGGAAVTRGTYLNDS